MDGRMPDSKTIAAAGCDDHAQSARAAATTSRLWAIAIHSAAGRRWLAYDPPRLDEVDKTLAQIERVGAGFPLSRAAIELRIARNRHTPARCDGTE